MKKKTEIDGENDDTKNTQTIIKEIRIGSEIILKKKKHENSSY